MIVSQVGIYPQCCATAAIAASSRGWQSCALACAGAQSPGIRSGPERRFGIKAYIAATGAVPLRMDEVALLMRVSAGYYTRM